MKQVFLLLIPFILGFTVNAQPSRHRILVSTDIGGGGTYVVRYAPKAPATLTYSITSDIPGFNSHNGSFTVGEKWPAVNLYTLSSGNITSAPIRVGDSWFTDCQEYDTRWQGATSIARWREDIMRHWAERFKWLK